MTETYRIRIEDGSIVAVSEEVFLEREHSLRECNICDVYYDVTPEKDETCALCGADVCEWCLDLGEYVDLGPKYDKSHYCCSLDCVAELKLSENDRAIQDGLRHRSPDYD